MRPRQNAHKRPWRSHPASAYDSLAALERNPPTCRGCAVITGKPDDREEGLEDEIRALLSRVDPVAADVNERARRAAAVGAGPAGSELLEIAYDSVLDESLEPFRP